MDGAESVRSERSNRSERSRHSHGSRHHHRHHHARQSGRASSDVGGRTRGLDERSVTIKTPGHLSEGDERAPGEERFEVQVIPQDDNWGDNTTAITGMIRDYSSLLEQRDNLSHVVNSMREFNRIHRNNFLKVPNLMRFL